MNARDILAASRVKVLNKHPYFDSCAFSLRLAETPGLGTLAVDAGLRLFYDPVKVEEWGVEMVAGVLVHEMSHVLRDHHGRMKDLDHMLSNLAGDMEINDDVLRMGWKLPGEPVLPKSFGLKDGELAEYYARELRKKAKNAQAKAGAAPGTGGKCGGCANNPGPEGMGDGKDGKDKGQGKPGQGEGGGQGGNVPAPMDATEVNIIRKQTAQKIVDHQATRGRGSIPGSWAAWAEKELEPPKIAWEKVLARHLRAAIAYKAGMVDYTSKRIARSYWGQRKVIRNMPLKPGMHQPIPKVALVVDCSGSMSGKPYERALAETMGVVKAVGAPCACYATDAAIQARQSIFGKKDLSKIGFSGGGTDMRIGIRKADEDKADVIVVLTDGDTPWPTASEMPRAKLVACIIGNQKTPKHMKDVVYVDYDGEAA